MSSYNHSIELQERVLRSHPPPHSDHSSALTSNKAHDDSILFFRTNVLTFNIMTKVNDECSCKYVAAACHPFVQSESEPFDHWTSSSEQSRHRDPHAWVETWLKESDDLGSVETHILIQGTSQRNRNPLSQVIQYDFQVKLFT